MIPMMMPTIEMISNTPTIIIKIRAQFFPVKSATPTIRPIKPKGRRISPNGPPSAVNTVPRRMNTTALRICKIPIIVTPNGLSIVGPAPIGLVA